MKRRHFKCEAAAANKARGGACLSLVRPIPLRQATKKKDAERRQTQITILRAPTFILAACAAGQRRGRGAASIPSVFLPRVRGRAGEGRQRAYRRSTAVLAKGTIHPDGSASGHVSWGRDAVARSVTAAPTGGRKDRAPFWRALPAAPVPAQGCTSRPGHGAGRRDARAARERFAKPPAGTALAPWPGLPPDHVLNERGWLCNVKRDGCQGGSSRNTQQADRYGSRTRCGLYQPAQILNRHARARRGHPRLNMRAGSKTWMAGTSPAMTTIGLCECWYYAWHAKHQA